MQIEIANQSDLQEILALQYLAYRSEAELYHDFSIPPLTQTLDEIVAEFHESIFLKAIADGRLVGSVRGKTEVDICKIGRLIVHPDFQGGGIGTRLLAEIEAHFPAVRRFELFTGQSSQNNLRLYQKAGYKEFRQSQLNEKITLVFLDKPGKL